MHARRLFCILLVIMLALPLAASAQSDNSAQADIREIRIEYEGVDGTGAPALVNAQAPLDYDWGFTEDGQPHIWIRLFSDAIPRERVRVYAQIWNGFDLEEYTFYDSFNQTDWLNLSMVDTLDPYAQMPPFELVRGEMRYHQSIQLTMGTDVMFGESWGDLSGDIDQYQYDNTLPEDTDPNAGNYDLNDINGGLGENIPQYDGSLPENHDQNQGFTGDVGNGNPNTGYIPPAPDALNTEDEDLPSDAGADTYNMENRVVSALGGIEEPPAQENNDPQTFPEDIKTTYAYASGVDTVFYRTPDSNSADYSVMPLNYIIEKFEDAEYTTQTDVSSKYLMVAVRFTDANGVEQKGYVLLDQLTFMTEEQERQHIESLKPQNEEFPSIESNYARVSTDGAVMRPQSGGAETTIARDAVVLYEANLNRNYYNDEETGYLWMLVTDQVSGQTGYMWMKTLNFMTRQQEEEYQNSLLQKMPDHVNDYAYVTQHGAYLYNASEGKINPLNTRDVVIYQPTLGSFHNKTTKKLFIPVVVDNAAKTSGYVMVDDITFMTAAELDQYKRDNTPTPSPPPMPATRRYAWITENDVQVRPNPNSAPQYRLQKDDVVLVHGLERDSGNLYWYNIEIAEGSNKGKMGYVRSDFVQLMSEREEQLYLDSLSKPTPTAPLSQTRGYMRVNTAYAPQLSWPDLGGSIIGILNANEVVYVDSQTYDASGSNVFSLVLPLSSGANWGYVQQRYLTPMSASEVNAYFATPRPTPTAVPTYAPSTFSGYAVLVTNSVNFRTSPSSANNNNVIRRLSQNTIVRVISETTAEGYNWYQVESGGNVGYLRGDMLSLLSVREYQLLVSSPSYNQNGTVITPTATANVNGGGTPTWTTAKPNATSTITFVTIPPMATGSPGASSSPDASASPDPSASASPDASGVLGVSASPSPNPVVTLPPAGGGDDPDFPKQESNSSASTLIIALVVLLVLGAGGFYGYSIYNKNRKQQQAAQAKRGPNDPNNKPPTGGGSGGQPAVRRPAPPTQPGAPGQQSRPGAGSAPQTPGSTQPRPGANGQNPYARPQQSQPPRTQEVTSSVPRAQVDGRPVGAGGAQQNPYARPGGAQVGNGQQQTQRPATPSSPAGAPGTGTQANPMRPGVPPAQENAGACRQRMPVAPPPVQPDEVASAPEGEAAPRRRRRRYNPEGGTGETTNENNE